MRVRVSIVGAIAASGVLAFVALAARPEARQQTVTAAPPELAQNIPPPAGSPFSLLPGFKVERVTPGDKTESYIVLTFDSLGRPVVGQSVSGNGSSPRLLLDNDGDGIFESEKVISDRLNTCHGLWYEGRTLYANCFGPRDEALDGPAPPAGAAAPAGGGGGGRGAVSTGIPGFYKLEDTNGDDVADTLERITRYVANGMGDHGPHAIRRAPDGGIDLIIGNNTFVPDDRIDAPTTPNYRNLKERQFLPASPDPRFGNSTKEGIHGPFLKYQPANRKFSVLYSGLRNAYDFTYSILGEPFTFDSDMEWDVNSPWYRQVNTKHMIPGGDGGYRNGTGKLQDEYFDVLPALRYTRRGSPVGVETYQSYAYPAKYFDTLFEADWSRGRLLYTALTPKGATYSGRQDLAEFVHGEPMPITDIEVGPDGNLYFVTGGTAGTGGLYKVTWTGAAPAKPDMTGILAVVRQPQPLSSWGWANIEKLKASMGAAFATDLQSLARNSAAASLDRSRALLEMQRHGAPPSSDLLRSLVTDRDGNVRATSVFVAGMQSGDGPRAVAAAALKDVHPLVQRRAAEAVVRQGLVPTQPSFAPVADLVALLNSPDRFVRYSARVALEHTPRADWQARVMTETNIYGATEGLLALINTKTSEADLRPIFDRTIALMRRPALTNEQKVRVLRTFQVGATETARGVDPEIKKQVHDILLPMFPATAPVESYVDCEGQMPGTTQAGCELTRLTHHLAKVLAYTGEADVIAKVLAVMPKGDLDMPGQIDYMYALRVIDRGWAPTETQLAIDWFGKASKWRGGSTFAGHVNTIFDQTVDAFSPADRQRAYDAAPLFAPLTPDELIAPAAGRGGAPGAAGVPGAPAGAPGAATPPAAGTPPTGAPAAPAGAPGAARGGGGGGGRGGAQVPATARQTALEAQERYDNLVFPRGSGPGSLAGRGGAPNATAGAQVFKDSCASCHKFGTVGASYAPDLSTIGTTVLRRDILRAIFFPSETVAAKYETVVVATRDNKTIRGVLVSETPQNLVLKTADQADPVTVAKAQIARRTSEKVSIMPSDLPDKVGDQNVANVVAYLMGGR